MGKIKARDIIPGWPRGRSTSPSAEDEHYRTLMRVYFGWTPFRFWLGELDELDAQFEVAYETIYHLMQQAMVNEFRKDPVTFYNRHLDSLMSRVLVGELARVVGTIDIDERSFKLLDL